MSVKIKTKPYQIALESDFNGPSSRGFIIKVNEQDVSGFVVYDGGQYFAYENKCPHTGAPLDWIEHQFLDADAALIQCSVHDARFDIETGECLFGPCVGEYLESLPVYVEQGVIYWQA